MNGVSAPHRAPKAPAGQRPAGQTHSEARTMNSGGRITRRAIPILVAQSRMTGFRRAEARIAIVRRKNLPSVHMKLRFFENSDVLGTGSSVARCCETLVNCPGSGRNIPARTIPLTPCPFGRTAFARPEAPCQAKAPARRTGRGCCGRRDTDGSAGRASGSREGPCAGGRASRSCGRTARRRRRAGRGGLRR